MFVNGGIHVPKQLQPRSQGLSSSRPSLGGKMRDPGNEAWNNLSKQPKLKH